MEAKFKLGDKVRLTSAGAKEYPTFDNKVGTIEEILENVSYPYYLTFKSGSQAYPVTDAEIELVNGPTLEDRVASLEKRLDALEFPLGEEPVPDEPTIKAENLSIGAIIRLVGDKYSRFIKVGNDQWVWFNNNDSHAKPWVGEWVNTDERMGKIAEVIREGV